MHQDGDGIYLAQRDNGAYEFLNVQGCTVHPDRPLVCRVYRLGRHVSEDGSERFSRLETHPLSKGEVTSNGTITAYLESQGAGPFMKAADEYHFWLLSAAGQLEGE
jgi:uncharacterized protein